MKKTLGTEPFDAPVQTPVAPQPVYQAPPQVQRTIERQGMRTEPYTRRLPQVRGGVCEFCGILDRNVPAQDQYKLCPHFRGIPELRCSYCDEAKNPTDVNLKAVLNIAEHPDNPNKLVVWCNSYECSNKHEKRFRVNR